MLAGIQETAYGDATTMRSPTRTVAVLATVAGAVSALAGDRPYFNPLTQSTAVASPNHINELSSPWQVPVGMTQRNLMSLREVEADLQQSVQRVPAGTMSSMFDMLAYDPSGRYLFIPHETPFGAGLSRYDSATDRTEILFAGSGEAGADSTCPNVACPAWKADFAAFDPARWTPNGTVLLGEEWSGLGRLVEVLKPLAPAPENPVASALTPGEDYRVLESIANVAHEGISFSVKYPNQVIYYIDEWNSGSIYALVLKRSGDYVGGGQTFVLSVDEFASSGGDPAANWNEGANVTAQRFGMATWKPITDHNGAPFPSITDPFRDGPTKDPRTVAETRGGRAAADDVGGTPYGRPEDMEVGLLGNFNEVLYVATTSEQAVIAIEMLGNRKAVVRQLVSADTPTNAGFPATTGRLNSPDNIAQDALGNLYVIEDSPNRGDVGGDIWFVRDTDNDGVGESLDHFMSLQVAGSESTGMIFNPVDPTKFVVAVQHPSSTNLDEVPQGMGDAVWEFDVSQVLPPACTSDGLLDSWDTGYEPPCDEPQADTDFTSQLRRANDTKPRAAHVRRPVPPVSLW